MTRRDLFAGLAAVVAVFVASRPQAAIAERYLRQGPYPPGGHYFSAENARVNPQTGQIVVPLIPTGRPPR